MFTKTTENCHSKLLNEVVVNESKPMEELLKSVNIWPSYGKTLMPYISNSRCISYDRMHAGVNIKLLQVQLFLQEEERSKYRLQCPYAMS